MIKKLADYLDDVGNMINDYLYNKKNNAMSKSEYCLYSSLDFIDYGLFLLLFGFIAVVIGAALLIAFALDMPFIFIPIILGGVGYILHKKCNIEWSVHKNNETEKDMTDDI